MHPEAYYTASQLTVGLGLGANRMKKLVEAGLKPDMVIDPDGKGKKTELYLGGTVLAMLAPK